jgi:hypothetical protein
VTLPQNHPLLRASRAEEVIFDSWMVVVDEQMKLIKERGTILDKVP